MSEANEVDGKMFRETKYFPIIYQQVSGTTRVTIDGLMMLINQSELIKRPGHWLRGNPC